MADSIENKLKKFQSVCEDKLQKIENLQHQFEKNEEVLRGYENDNSMRIELAKLNLNIAQIQLDTAVLREKKRTEQERHQLLEEETKQFNEEKAEALAHLEDMMDEISYMKTRMEIRVGTLTDFATARRETYLMTVEENRTISSLILDATKRTQADQRIEWLQKLINATSIQQSESERRLTELKAKCSSVV